MGRWGGEVLADTSGCQTKVIIVVDAEEPAAGRFDPKIHALRLRGGNNRYGGSEKHAPQLFQGSLHSSFAISEAKEGGAGGSEGIPGPSLPFHPFCRGSGP
jgi:hypothetical protein